MKQTFSNNEDQFELQTHLNGWELFPVVVVLGGGVLGQVADAQPDAPWTAPIPEMLRGVWGMMWVILGLVMLTYRRGAIIDRREQTVTRWWALAGLNFYVQTIPLAARSVCVDEKMDRWDQTCRTFYTIYLAGAGGKIKLAHGGSGVEAREIGMSLGAFLGVPVSDGLARAGAT